MTEERYRFRVGTFECIVVSDGTFAYPDPARLLFVDAPDDDLSQALHEHDLDPARWERLVSPYPCLLVDTGRHRVLVDTGAGSLASTTGRLVANLRAEGIAPESIDVVVLTHAHPDHIGGASDDAGRPTFPNARCVLAKAEWDYWMAGPDPSHWHVGNDLRALILESPRKKLGPIEERLDLVEGEPEIVPGLRYVAAPGHTPGHMAVVLDSGGTRLVHLADTAIHPIHLRHPGWCAAVDLAPAQTAATRQHLLARVAADHVPVLFSHFPFPCLGHVIRDRQAWRWEPLP